jgi:hypothetical protein
MGDPVRYLSQGVDYLGFLDGQLRNLRGYSTLANEFLQNADDARATTMTFDFQDRALVIENNSVFSDCRSDDHECPWKRDPDPNTARRCDFHRFRLVAGADKRNEVEVIGAFGVGFISAYQITDQPELISAGRHWIIRPDQPEDRRIEERVPVDVAGTVFRLPWAFSKDSTLRKALHVEPVTAEGIARFRAELETALRSAILFLRHIRSAEIRANGRTVKRVECLKDDNQLVVQEDAQTELWHLLEGSFGEEATRLREQEGGRIGAKRANVTVAFPESERTPSGLLCAYLPTEHQIGMQFHVNADFFPSSDRKRVFLDSNDYQQRWNETAIRAAARLVGDNLPALRDVLGHQRLWKTLQRMEEVEREVKEGERETIFAEFWKTLSPTLRELEIVRTSTGSWRNPGDALLLRSAEEEEALPILEAVGLQIVHPELRFAHNLLIGPEVGVRILSAFDLAEALQVAGLDRPVQLSSGPEWIRNPEMRSRLDSEVSTLLDHFKGQPVKHATARGAVSACAIALGRDRVLWPCEDIYSADEETISLFETLGAASPFLGSPEYVGSTIWSLCPSFSAQAAIDWLARMPSNDLESAYSTGRLDPARLLEWFEGRRNEVLTSDALRNGLANLPIFPAASRLNPLSALQLPGGFFDPLALTEIVDVEKLGGRTEFLRDLGASELTFGRYAAQYIPQAFADAQLGTRKKRQVVRLLAERLGEIRDDEEARLTLANLAIVECQDGHFHEPKDAYFPDSPILELLGEAVPVAAIPQDRERTLGSLYEWLGVAREPHYHALIQRAKDFCANLPAGEYLQRIQAIFEYLAEHLRKTGTRPPGLTPLCSMAWLPARGKADRWYRPQELFAAFQDYLFESQALFLDLPREVQGQASELLSFLGVRLAPDVSQVVSHLLKCSDVGVPVNKEVYRFLNDHAQDRALLRLEGKACLLIPSNTYVKPEEVFWGEHPFGCFRHRLGPDLRRYQELLSRLDVRELPTHEDAERVLREISDEFGSGNVRLDDDAYAVILACWQMLSSALDDGTIGGEALRPLQALKVIPDRRHILSRPDWIFFEDRAGLASKFAPFLQYNVIPRPHGAWKAMAAAGVRALRSAVDFELVECVDPVDDDVVLQRLRGRHLDLLRVLEPEAGNSGSDAHVALLDSLRFQSVSDLRIQYSLHFSTHDPPPVVESVPAHFQADLASLFFVRGAAGRPWAPIARELALALCPDTEPGRIASGIKEVLAADSDGEAHHLLDDLGFPPLEQAPPAPTLPDQIKEFGEPTNGDRATPAGQTGAGERQQETPGPLSPKEAVQKILGTDGGAPGPMPPSLQEPVATPGVGGNDGGRSQPGGAVQKGGSHQHQGRLRTYVSYTSDDGDGAQADAAAQAQRSAVDQAGVNRVVEYEQESGRLPEVKPPKHPGYDIESRDTGDQILRYIEVKSLSGAWGRMGVGLSKPEFEKAREIGDCYWLYVVERAQEEDYKIHRIQNPAWKANQFFYDDGWAVLAEEDQPRAEREHSDGPCAQQRSNSSQAGAEVE